MGWSGLALANQNFGAAAVFCRGLAQDEGATTSRTGLPLPLPCRPVCESDLSLGLYFSSIVFRGCNATTRCLLA
jgi:hypothetical protein